jgi:hypothetical protein
MIDGRPGLGRSSLNYGSFGDAPALYGNFGKRATVVIKAIFQPAERRIAPGHGAG